jgi:plasmid stability protein
MARKKAEGPKVEPEAKLKPVRLDLSPRAHRLLRMVAAHEDASMAAYARDALTRLLETEARRLGIRE